MWLPIGVEATPLELKSFSRGHHCPPFARNVSSSRVILCYSLMPTSQQEAFMAQVEGKPL